MRRLPATITTMAQDTPFPMLGGLSFSDDPVWRLLDDLFAGGVVGDTAYQVIQNPAGANMSVSVQPGSGYVPITNGGKRRTRLPAQSNSGAPGSPNAADNWLTTFIAADATNPRIDRVVLTARDTDVDGSGARNSALRVVAGTPTGGATLVNLNGAATVPPNSILLANVLVPATSTTVTTANIVDVRPHAALGNGAAASPAAKIATTSSQSISNGVTTIPAMGTVAAWAQGGQTVNAPSGAIGMTTPGLYLVVLFTNWAGNVTGIRSTTINRYNNANALQEAWSQQVSAGGVGESGIAAAILPMILGDYVQATVFQNSGGALLVNVTMIAVKIA